MSPVAGVPLVGSSGLDYLYIPVVSTIGVLLLALVLRWSMQTRSRRAGTRVADPAQGLLIGVVSAAPAEADRIRDLLVSAGVRASYRPGSRVAQVLVWPEDVDAATRIVAADRGRSH